MTCAPHELVGLRVLVVEDEFLIALSLKATLEGFGCQVVGPVASVDEGRSAAVNAPIDVALVDVNIVGGSSFSVAEDLRQRGCPLAFLTGYSDSKKLPVGMADVRRLVKPLESETLRRALVDLSGERPSA